MAMLTFKQFLAEAAKPKKTSELPLTYEKIDDKSLGSGVDEHAFATVWNHMIQHHKDTPSDKLHKTLINEINRHFASKGEAHQHLSLATYAQRRGKEIPGHKANQAAWQEQLTRAAKTVAEIVDHEHFKAARKKRFKASVAGATHTGELTPTWRSHGATNRTSRADVVIGDVSKPGHARVSIKHGHDAQIASMEPSQFSATADYATQRAGHKKGSPEHRRVMELVQGIVKSMKAISKTTRGQVGKGGLDARKPHVAAIGKHLDTLHAEFPELHGHIVREAITGHGQFGEHSYSTPTHVLTYGRNTTSVRHVDEIDTSNYRLRGAAGKGVSSRQTMQNRPGTVRVEYNKGKRK